jgi:hypothetical protein
MTQSFVADERPLFAPARQFLVAPVALRRHLVDNPPGLYDVESWERS